MTEDERKALQRIKDSEELSNSPGLIDLLDFFAARMGRSLDAGAIEEEFYRVDRAHPKHKPARSRGRVMELRDKLDLYKANHPDEEWVCSIGEKGARASYELKLIRPGQRRPSDVFWWPYLDRRKRWLWLRQTTCFFLITSG